MRATLVFGHNPGPLTGQGSNSWLLGGRVPTLIDTCSGAPAFMDELRGVAEVVGHPVHVLVTHGHSDHAGGAAALAAEWPGVKFSKCPWAEQDARFPVTWHPLADGATIDAGDTQLWVVHTPGHAPDHVCYFEPRSGTLFGGDLVLNGGTVVIPASSGGRLSQYLESLHRILELAPKRILPGHGPIIDRPASLLRGYLAHRHARERQIVAVLEGGSATVPALVARIYKDLDPAVSHAAGESVLAHLVKLQEEGRARHDGDADPIAAVWQLT